MQGRAREPYVVNPFARQNSARYLLGTALKMSDAISLIDRLSQTLSRQGTSRVAGIGALLFLVMAVLDYATGPEFESSIFYLIPVSFVGWFIGRRAGLAGAGVGAVLTLAVHAAFAQLRHPTIVFWNAAAWFAVYALAGATLGELRGLYERERRFSRTDALTGVANRRAFFEALESEVSRAIRYGLPLTLAYIDVDHFKQINDRLGHAGGDEVLVTVASTMHGNVRRPDVVARLGGDEFAVLLPEIGADAAVAVLRKLHNALDAAVGSRRWPVTFSVGAVAFVRPPESIEDVIRAADQAMYTSKANGRDQLVVRTSAA